MAAVMQGSVSEPGPGQLASWRLSRHPAGPRAEWPDVLAMVEQRPKQPGRLSMMHAATGPAVLLVKLLATSPMVQNRRCSFHDGVALGNPTTRAGISNVTWALLS
jgi:hypothetical protein